MKEHLDFNDLMILPAVTTYIDNRDECDVTIDGTHLPIFTAPMDTVVSKKNSEIFKNNGIIPILPRNKELNYYNYEDNWVALGLDGFYTLFCDGKIMAGDFHILIDIANGHMSKLLEYIKKAKRRYGNRLIIMAGNVANPETYTILSDAGADYVRLGIGGGAACLTTTNTAIGYPMATLISNSYEKKSHLNDPAYIVADGGMRNYSDIIKALALGADYVMLGSILNKSLESDAPTFKEVVNRDGSREVGEHVDPLDKNTRTSFKGGARFYKHFRGMSTKDVQKALGRSSIRTSEGVSRMRLVEYTLDGWVENFKHYLSSAMSYTNRKKLKDFIGGVTLIKVSENSYKRIIK